MAQCFLNSRRILAVVVVATLVGAGRERLSLLEVEQEVAALASIRPARPGRSIQFNNKLGQCVSLTEWLKDIDIDDENGIDTASLKRIGEDLIKNAKPCNLPLNPDMFLSSSDAKSISESSMKSNATVKRGDQAKIWISSTIAVIVISAVGLLGVAIVPVMQKVFYNHVIQFLVALAVGSLTGDAMLHLLPHSITAAAGGHDAENEENEKQAIFKGLTALMGLYFFFVAEKLVAIISESRAEKKAEEEERRKAAKTSRKPSTMLEWRTEEMRRKSLRCEGTVTTGLSSQAMKSIDNLQRYRVSDMDTVCTDEANLDENATEGTRLTVAAKRLSLPHQIELKTTGNGGTPHMSGKSQSISRFSREKIPESYEGDDSGTELQRRENPLFSARVEVNHDNAHGHDHGHSHVVPDSIASVAWMVILGDGLHNFTDGLAIGAAFAKNFTGGLSTSIAVFCHELPHELGDFAVLLTTGMSVKQALLYNILSSVLCLIGMFIGIALGNVESASYWIFAMTAGIFIYVALVDMLPELNSINAQPGESRLAHFVIQNSGIVLGVGIMLLIAMFEDNIKSAFD